MAIDPFVARQPDYSDLDLDFICHPTTKDVVIKKGEDAIKRSVRNLVMTNFYDKPFRSTIGSNVRGFLFENMDPITVINLQDAISSLLTNFEPRVTVTRVVATPDVDNNGYNVRVEYVIVNRNLPSSTTLFLERIR